MKNRKPYFIREGLFKKKKKNIREIIIQEDYKITFIEKCRALFYELKSQGYDVGPNEPFWAAIGKTYDQINFDNEKDEDGCYYCKFIIDEDEKTVGREYTRPREPEPFTPYKIGYSDEDDGLVGYTESLKESENKKIKNLISRIEVYKDIVSNSWVPMPWEVAYSKVPEGLKLTIDTDEWFDEENPLGHLIDFILDIYNADYDSSVRELTGIDIYSDVDFLGGEKSGYATYLIKNNESSSLKETKLEEGPWPKWKQKILDDINEICDIVYPIVNDENGEWKEPEKYLSFSVNKFIAFIKTLVDAEKYSENLLKYAAIDLWIDLHCDDSVGDFNDSETQIKYAKYHNLRKELWNALCDEYQAKYGRKRKPQPYIKDPTDASEIFDKVYQLRHENKSLKMDFEKIYKSANQ
jgi:hypothetical protein